MKRNCIRIIALLLVLLTMSGCAKKEAVEPNRETDALETTADIQPTQPEVTKQEMPEEELALALREIELSVLCAGFAAVKRQGHMENQWYNSLEQVCYNDYNGDGTPDILLGGYDGCNLTFSLQPERTVFYENSEYCEGFNHYYVDDQNRLYRWSAYYDPDPDGHMENGKHLFKNDIYEQYEQYENGKWNIVYSYSGYVLQTPGEGEQAYIYQTVEDHVDGYINEKKVTRKELDDRLASIGMTYVTTQADEFTTHTYALSYQDSLLTQLDQYFSEQYPEYPGAHTADVDHDGQEETLFFLPEIDDVWYQTIKDKAYDSFRMLLKEDLSLNGIVIADAKEDKLVIEAYAAPERIQYHADMTIGWDGCFLMIGDSVIYGGNMAEQTNVPEALARYLDAFGFKDCVLRTVDVSDMEEEEYLCLVQKDGIRYVILIVLKNGNPSLVYSAPLEDTAIYLTEQDGKQCLLAYTQDVSRLSNGLTTNNFLYSLFRFDDKGEQVNLESKSAAYNDSTTDATNVAAFFEKLNVYLMKIIVIYDPYELTGKQWMDQSDVQYGTVPETPRDTPEDATMGFVQIEDPSSWLNLREGPGVEYAKVLTDPGNPESFVRQALGSPVTILETVETGDAENPVWVKVRISYGDREYVGYCSKSYIRLAGE